MNLLFPVPTEDYNRRATFDSPVYGRVRVDSRPGAFAAAHIAGQYRDRVNAAHHRWLVMRREGAPSDVLDEMRAYTLGLTQRFGAALEGAGKIYESQRMDIRDTGRSLDARPLRGIADFTIVDGVARQVGWRELWSTPQDWIRAGRRLHDQATAELEQRYPESAVGMPSQVDDTMGFLPALPVGATVAIYGIGIIAGAIAIVAIARYTLRGLFAYLGVDLRAQDLALNMIERTTQHALEACSEIQDPAARAACYRTTQETALEAISEASEIAAKRPILPVVVFAGVALGGLWLFLRSRDDD